MPVNYLPGVIDPTTQAMLAQLGQSLGSLLGVGEDNRFASMVKDNPNILPVIAQMVRNANPSAADLGNANRPSTSGADLVAGLFGFHNPNAFENVSRAIPATVDEQVQSTLRSDPSYVPAVIRAQRQQPEVATAQGTAAIAQSRAALPAAEVTRRGAEAQLQHNTPELEAATSAAKLNLEQGLATEQQNALREYDSWLARQPPEIRARGAMSLVNSALAGSLQQELQHNDQMRLGWANLSLQEKELQLRQMSAGQHGEMTPLQQYELMHNLNRDISDEIALLRKAVDDDNKDEVRVRTSRINELTNLHRTYFPGQRSFVAEEDQRFLFNRGIMFTETEPKSPEEMRTQSFDTVISAVQAGTATMADVTTSEFFRNLPAQERSALMARITDARNMGTAMGDAQNRGGTVGRNQDRPQAGSTATRGGARATLTPAQIEQIRAELRGLPGDQARRVLVEEGLGAQVDSILGSGANSFQNK